MAAITKIVRDLITGSIREEGDPGIFHKQLNAFQQHLLPALPPEEFADLYAQTMAYGLFAAKVNHVEGKEFSRAQAYLYLPPANPFLRKLFHDVGDELEGSTIAPFLDDLVALLNRADMIAILTDFGKRTRTEDAVVHFYETFLAAYDPKLREARGVYYTPEPVVQFIVNSVDELLETEFDRPQGLADSNVLLLDPAAGTATFLYSVIRHIYESEMGRGQKGAWKDYVREKLLPRIFGFELLMAPYAVAHLKLGLLLNELGYSFGKHERLKVYLTNTLEEAITKAETLGLAGYLSEEGSEAAEIKKQKPIMVVLGNPPYSGHSANRGKWIDTLVRDYYLVDGKPLGERNPKWLQDDYVKFIRFAQWRIQQTGQGIVALITNHGYLDNPTFRGMRQSLLNTFDKIYVMDLHGNTKKKEIAPDGGADENVFDIQQGVAILLAIKKDSNTSNRQGVLYHAHLYGPRAKKYAYLNSHSLASAKWKELKPTSPAYLFVPQNTRAQREYQEGWRLPEIFPVNSLGFVTSRDHFALDFDANELRKRINDFRNPHLSDERIRREHKLNDTRDWKLAERRKHLINNRTWKDNFAQAIYRPFDIRHIYYSPDVIEMPRLEVMANLLQANVAMVTTRQTRDLFGVLAVDKPTGHKSVAAYDSNSVFPLYLYPNGDYPPTLFDHDNGRRPNLSDKFIAACSAQLKLTFVPDGQGDLKKTFGPEDVFYYAYAVFHSPAYRARYAEFLKTDFPRLPLTSDKKLFAKLVEKGAELANLHLMKSSTLDNFITEFSVEGDNVVDQARGEKKKIWINATQFFGGVPEEVREFQVGGYQVCEKWLKDRKGLKLSNDDLNHYQRVVVALKETIRLMKEIDKAIPNFPID